MPNFHEKSDYFRENSPFFFNFFLKLFSIFFVRFLSEIFTILSDFFSIFLEIFLKPAKSVKKVCFFGKRGYPNGVYSVGGGGSQRGLDS